MQKLAGTLLVIGTGLSLFAHGATPLLVTPAAVQSVTTSPTPSGGGNTTKAVTPGTTKPVKATLATDRIYTNIKSEVDLVALLRTQNKQLRALVKDLSARLEQIKQEKPFCSDVATSANNAGMSRSCGAYICDPAQGTCLQQATSSLDCAPGYLWDSGSKCVTPPPPPDNPCPHWYSCL